MKPGFTRVNLHWTMTAEEVEYIANCIIFLSEHGADFISEYLIDWKTGNWIHHSFEVKLDTLFDGTIAGRKENKEFSTKIIY
eukprot:UN34516